MAGIKNCWRFWFRL